MVAHIPICMYRRRSLFFLSLDQEKREYLGKYEIIKNVGDKTDASQKIFIRFLIKVGQNFQLGYISSL